MQRVEGMLGFRVYIPPFLQGAHRLPMSLLHTPFNLLEHTFPLSPVGTNRFRRCGGPKPSRSPVPWTPRPEIPARECRVLEDLLLVFGALYGSVKDLLRDSSYGFFFFLGGGGALGGIVSNRGGLELHFGSRLEGSSRVWGPQGPFDGETLRNA